MTDKIHKFDNSTWPKIETERHDWNIASSAMISRNQRRLHTGPYQAAVAPAITPQQNIPLSNDALAMSEDALAAAVRFDTEFGHDITPFSALLLRSESASSSQIENLTASAKAVALAEIGDTSRPNAQIIAGNTKAMKAAIQLADNIGTDEILATHRALLEKSAPEIVGTFRKQQVWIGGTSFGPHRADFVAPHHTRVPSAMDDLVSFTSRDDLPVLPQIAVAHAQFETIHPFPDGNRRTGRALMHSLLRSKGVTQHVTVPISAGLLTDVTRYFDTLGHYRNGNPEAIVQFVAEALFLAIENGQQLVQEIRDVRTSWQDQIKARSDSSVWKIMDLLVRQPVITSPLVQTELSISTPNALRAIKILEDAGAVVELGKSSRNRKWAASEILSALDLFAERSGRRSPPH